MNIFIHFLINFLITLPFLNAEQALIVGLVGIIIDLDHILYQLITLKHKSVKQMWVWHKQENKKHTAHLYIFHTIEFICILILLSHLSNIIFLITLGVILHVLIDLLVHITYGDYSWKKHILIYGSLRS